MRNPPRTIQEAFDLAARIEAQVQVADSFKIDLNNNFPTVDINKISTDKSYNDKFEVNEMSSSKKWVNNSNYRKTIKITEILITSLGTTVKHRKASQQRSGNKRRETQRSL